MKYNCNFCQYYTNDSGSWKKHINTNKHKLIIDEHNSQLNTKKTRNKNVILGPEKQYKCDYCQRIFTQNSSLKRHISICKNKLAYDYQQLLNNLENENRILRHNNKALADDKKHYKKISETTTAVAQKSMSTMNYLIQNKYEPQGLLPYNPNVLQGDKDVIQFAKIILNKYIHYNLAHFVGDALISFYKKKNPKNQSLWNSDSARLNYIIRAVDDNGGNKWVVDKHATKVKELLIKPLLEKIHETLNVFVTYKFSNNDIGDKASVFDILEKQAKAYEIMEKIKNNSIEIEVINYITPPFHLKQ